MGELLRRHSLLITSIALLIVSTQLMSLSLSNRKLPEYGSNLVDTAISPLEKGYHEALQSVSYLWRQYVWLIDVERDRRELSHRVKELEALNSRLMEYDSENRRLRTVLDFTERSGLRGVMASVVGRDPSNWVKSVTIDRGAADGIRPGLAVVDGHAIVGQTIAVTEHTARVLLLTDSSSSIDAVAQTNRAVGTIEGGAGWNLLRLRYVLKLKEYAVLPGERVIASGLDGVFPKGTLIGVVQRVNTNSAGLFQDIDVQPSIDVLRLESVLVVIPELATPITEGPQPQEKLAREATKAQDAASLRQVVSGSAEGERTQ